jgi:hypothetical protein
VRRLTILLAALVLLAAGCGGGGDDSGGGTTKPIGPPLTKQAYEQKLKSITQEVGNSVGDTGSTGKITDSEVSKVTAGFHRLVERLGELNPPAEVKNLHERLMKAIDEFAEAFPSLARKLNDSDKDVAKSFQVFFASKPIQELIKLGKEFKNKGYDLQLIR